MSERWTVREERRLEVERVKGSRFIASVCPVSDEATLRRWLAREKSRFPDATHHCWAVRLARPHWEKAVDDGEPSGSAGRPILAVLHGRDLVDVGVVVTRYFGGTKLGVGGLVRAYGGAAAALLDATDKVPYVERTSWLLRYAYADRGAVELVLRSLTLLDGEVTYGPSVERRVAVGVADAEPLERALRDATAGRVEIVR